MSPENVVWFVTGYLSCALGAWLVRVLERRAERRK